MTRLEGSLGLCRRAGKLVVGADPVYEALIRGRIKLVIAAFDTALNSTKKIRAYCLEKGIRFETVQMSKSEHSKCLGLERAVGVAGVPKEFFDIVSASL